MTASRGRRLALAGVLLFVATVGASAALSGGPAPPTAEGNATADRETLVGSQGGGPGWHRHGSVYLLNGSDTVWSEDSAESYFDVQRLDDGRVLAGFMDSGYEDCGPYDSPCAHTGYRIVDPDAAGGPAVVEEFGFSVRSESNSEVHDADRLPGGGYVLTDMDRERLVIVENESVVWSWNASSFYDAPADPTRTDWLHVNDVDRVGDGRFLVSVRNANQLLVVERTADGGSEVTEVINADDGGSDASCTRGGQLRDTDGDGDVRCGDPDVLNHQHNPQWLGDGAVLVADSDNDRAVELHRTESGAWEPVWVLSGADGLDFRWPRDADRLPNGNTLITDTLNKRLVEVDADGEAVWTYRTERVPYEADRVPRELTGGIEVDGDLPLMSAEDSVDATPDGGVPVLSTLVVGLRAVAPWVPVWFAETQIGLTLMSLALVLAGGVAAVRERRARSG